MTDFFDIILGIGVIIIAILILRAFGAWMLRIDEVISVQKEILAELKKYDPTPPENTEMQ